MHSLVTQVKNSKPAVALRALLTNDKGEVDMAGIILLAISMVFLSLGFIFLQLITSASVTLSDYVYSTNASINASYFTGYSQIVGITPLIVLLGFETAGVITGFMGIQVTKGTGTAKANSGSLVLLGLAIVFIAVGLIIEPIALDGISSAINTAGASSFTGYVTFLKMSPMLVHLGFLIASAVVGFFGIKMTSADNY